MNIFKERESLFTSLGDLQMVARKSTLCYSASEDDNDDDDDDTDKDNDDDIDVTHD